MSDVITVRGPVSPESLGHIAPHEHLLSDSSAQADLLHAAPTERLAELGITEAERSLILAPIELSTLSWIRRHALNHDNLTLDDEDAVAESLADFRQLGGATIIDCTPRGLHRNPQGLRRLAERVDLHIVMGSGWYLSAFQSATVADSTVPELADMMVTDLTEGADGTTIRAGVIGEIGTGWPIHPHEAKVLRAAATAQEATGAAIQVHPGRHRDAPRACVEILENAGADLTRVSLSHIDRTYTDISDMTRLAETGCYIEFDMFGQESTYYPYGWFDVPNDGQRVDLLARLIDAGYGTSLLISQDLGYRSLLPKWGGTGYAHILREVLPLMRRRGFASSDIELLTRTNPARWVSGEEVA